MMIGLFQPGTSLGIFEMIIGSRKMTPPRMLLQAELFDARLVWRYGRALDADTVLLDGVGRIDRDLVVGRIAVLDAEVVVLEIDIEVRIDERVFDLLPDDASHLIAIQLNDCAFYGDLGQAELLRFWAVISILGSRSISTSRYFSHALWHWAGSGDNL